MVVVLILFPAMAIDLILGDPPNFIHPVAWMGKVTSLLEKAGLKLSPTGQFIYGMGITLFIMALFALPTYYLLNYLHNLNFIAGLILAILLLKCTFSIRGLWRAPLGIKRLLQENKLDEARFELRNLVSRDTKDLPKPLLASATVESIAENACDSVVAPMFYFVLFGVTAAIGYRVVNTLDAMIGYHGKYEYLGKFAARLDDVLNFIPARITALLLVLAAFVMRKNWRQAWRIALHEHRNTQSINAGWPMAAMAGALDVRLEKVGHYRLGEANTGPVPESIDASIKLFLVATSFWVLVCLVWEFI